MADIRDLTIIKESEMAYYLSQKIRNDDTRAWIPKSMIDYIKKHPRNKDGTQSCDIQIPDWLAEQKMFNF